MNNRYWMIGLLVILAIVCSTALALVNYKTSPVIERNREIVYMRTVLDVFGISYDSINSDSIIDIYKQRIEKREAGELELFDDNETGATAVSMSGSGFQGPISIVVAIDGEIISGFKIVSQVETPGLGARITEQVFQDSFNGKQVSNGLKMTKSGNAGISEFDAITGATETSKALEKIFDIGFKRYFEVVGNGDSTG